MFNLSPKILVHNLTSEPRKYPLSCLLNIMRWPLDIKTTLHHINLIKCLSNPNINIILNWPMQYSSLPIRSPGDVSAIILVLALICRSNLLHKLQTDTVR